MASAWVNTPAGSWTRIWAAWAPFGFVYMSTSTPPVATAYRIYSANVPFYLDLRATIYQYTPIVVGLPTPYCEVWVNPDVNTLMRVT